MICTLQNKTTNGNHNNKSQKHNSKTKSTTVILLCFWFCCCCVVFVFVQSVMILKYSLFLSFPVEVNVIVFLGLLLCFVICHCDSQFAAVLHFTDTINMSHKLLLFQVMTQVICECICVANYKAIINAFVYYNTIMP